MKYRGTWRRRRVIRGRIRRRKKESGGRSRSSKKKKKRKSKMRILDFTDMFGKFHGQGQ